MSLKSVTTALAHVLDAFENSASINGTQRVSLEAARAVLNDRDVPEDAVAEVNAATARAAESATNAAAALQAVRDERAALELLMVQEGHTPAPAPVVEPVAEPVAEPEPDSE